MNETTTGLRIVAAPADGWCDPDTGTCHIGTTAEAPLTGEGLAHGPVDDPDTTAR